jgi:hypothetical protein
MVIRKVTARACLAQPGSEVGEARARAHAGDQDWQLWVDELERGYATLIDMRVTVTVELDDGTVKVVEAEDKQVWMHLAQHPPVVAGLVAEMSAKDQELLTERIRALGQSIGPTELDDMYVDVELADDLVAALRPGTKSQVDSLPAGARAGTVTRPE